MTESGTDWNNQIVNPKIFLQVKDGILRKHLQDLRGALDISAATLDAIQWDHVGQHKEVVFALLMTWREKKGKEATNGALCDALTQAGVKNLADNLREQGGGSSNMSGIKDSTNVSPQAGNLQTETDTPSTAAKPTETFVVPRYKMSSKARGKCLILTYDKFEGDEKGRPGNRKDEDALKKLFGRDCLDFDVDPYRNLTLEETEDVLEKISNEHHGDCFVLFVGSHGDAESFKTTDKEMITIQKVLSYFRATKCKNLAGKPKIFFFNTCRGKESQQATEIQDDNENPPEEIGIGAKTSYYAPDEADFFIVLSTVPGYLSYRHPVDGSYFVQTLCKCLKNHYEKLDLNQIVTITNSELIKAFGERMKGGKEAKCQVCTMIATPSKAVYFST